MKSLQGLIHSLESYVERHGARVTREPLPDFVHGRVQSDLISLRAGLTPRQEVAALIHEVAHWLVHRDPRAGLDCTVFEYEAEAVEALVLAHLGLGCGYDISTDDLMPASVVRVRTARMRICEALGVTSADAPLTSESQAAVDLQAAPGEEIVFEYEPYGMGDFLRLPEAL
jgi:hypothetical protein